jgi:hypothetical protein
MIRLNAMYDERAFYIKNPLKCRARNWASQVPRSMMVSVGSMGKVRGWRV